MNARRTFRFLGLLAAFAAGPAVAQVYQIDDGGEVQVRTGGGMVSWQPAEARPAALAPSAARREPLAAATVLEQAAAAAGLHPALLEALVWQESRWHADAVSPRGAVGLTQLMPATAQELGVDPRDPVANLHAGARYLRKMLDHFGGNVVLALAAYNAGPKRVEQAGGIPPIRETQNYVAGIMSRLDSTMATQ